MKTLLANGQYHHVLSAQSISMLPLAAFASGCRSLTDPKLEASNLFCKIIIKDLAAVANYIPALVLKSEINWPWEFALAVMHDVSARTINCLCVGLHDHEMLALIKSLQASASLAGNELLVPVSLLNITCRELSRNVDQLQWELWCVQKETGLHGARINDNPKDLSKLKLDNIIRKLTAISDHCTRSMSQTMTLERLLMPIEAILQEQCKNETEDHEIVQDHMQSIKQTIAGSQHYIKWYQSSTESQVQTVPRPLPIQCQMRIHTENG